MRARDNFAKTRKPEIVSDAVKRGIGMPSSDRLVVLERTVAADVGSLGSY